jgi:hypothetical protein
VKKTGSVVLFGMFLMAALAVDTCARTALGIKLGLVSADQTWEHSILGEVNPDHRLGMAFGLFAKLPIASVLEIRPGALYVQKGSQMKVTGMPEVGLPVVTRVCKERIDYLSLEAIAKVKVTDKTSPLYLFGGPRLDFKVGASTELASDVILDAYHSTVAGLRFGVGAERTLGVRGSLFAEVCYDYDFGEAAKWVGEEVTLTIDNRAVLVLVGVAF